MPQTFITPAAKDSWPQMKDLGYSVSALQGVT